MMKDSFLLYVIFNLLEFDFLSLIDSIVDGVYDVENLLVFNLSTTVNHNITFQVTCFINACQSGNFLDEVIAFFLL